MCIRDSLVGLQQFPGSLGLLMVVDLESTHADTPATGRRLVVGHVVRLEQLAYFVRLVVGDVTKVHEVVGHGRSDTGLWDTLIILDPYPSIPRRVSPPS